MDSFFCLTLSETDLHMWFTNYCCLTNWYGTISIISHYAFVIWCSWMLGPCALRTFCYYRVAGPVFHLLPRFMRSCTLRFSFLHTFQLQ
jgi:NAD-dependent oxidoreductase involved in siderophore biosynthesis